MKIQTISVKWMMFGCLFCLMICLCTCDTSCKMIRQYGKRGIDDDWKKSGITPFESENSTIEYCEDRCLKNQLCIALHYTSNTCFIFYEISILEDNANSVVSEKNCSNTPHTSCNMVRQNGKIGLDADWKKSGITPFNSVNSTTGIEYCEDRCLKNQLCIAVHYTHNYCFIYYEISILEDNANSVVSVKTCSNTPHTSCKMVRQNGKIGLDDDWLKSGIIPFKSENSATGIEYCEDRCLKNQRCIALHYLNNYCFIYYEISIIEDHANSFVSVKTCSNIPPSTTTTEDPTTTTTTEDPTTTTTVADTTTTTQVPIAATTTTTTMVPGMGTTMESTTANVINSGEHVVKLNILPISFMIMICCFILQAE